MWTLTLEQMVTQIGDMSTMEDLHFSNLARTLNVGVAKHAEELRSFKQALAGGHKPDDRIGRVLDPYDIDLGVVAGWKDHNL
jgi:hypothetical protein